MSKIFVSKDVLDASVRATGALSAVAVKTTTIAINEGTSGLLNSACAAVTAAYLAVSAADFAADEAATISKDSEATKAAVEAHKKAAAATSEAAEFLGLAKSEAEGDVETIGDAENVYGAVAENVGYAISASASAAYHAEEAAKCVASFGDQGEQS